MNNKDPNYHNPIYWIENILPAEYRTASSFIVYPRIGTVVPVENIQDPTVRNNFIMGNPSGYEPYLEYGTLYYPQTARPWQPGNTVIFGHSSHLKLDSNKIGNTFKMLPLAQAGDIFYIVQKDGDKYYTYGYQVNQKKIVAPEQVDILDQDVQGNIATLITCYPIGSLDERVVVTATPITNIIDQTMIEMLNSLSLYQQVTLRQIADTNYQQYIRDETPIELVILKLQQAREKLAQRTDLTAEQKKERDTIRQFLIYQYIHK